MNIRSIYFWGAGLLLLLALAGLAVLGTFTRFHGDDFCMAVDAGQIGLAGMLAKWYATWTGRFMFILMSGLFGQAGPGFAGWLSALAMAAWLAGLSWAALPLVRRAGWPRPGLLSVIAGSFGLLVLLSSTPNLFQSFYWQDGLVNYSLPLIGLAFIGGITLRAWLVPANRWVPAIGVFLLALVCGGFTEAYAAMQAALFTLALLVTLILGDRTLRRSLAPVLGAALAGGLLALLMVVIAPGNQVRQGAVGDHPGLVRIISFSMRNAAFIFGKFIIQTPIWAFLSMSLPFLTAWLFNSGARDGAARSHSSLAWWRQTWLRRLVGLGLAAFILVAAACAPVVYALNAYPDERTIIIPLFVVVSAVIGASALLGAGLRRSEIIPDPREKPIAHRVLQAGILAILVLGAGYSIWQTAAQAPDYQAYARAWDQRALAIEQAVDAGESDVTVAGLNARFGVADLNESPDYWVNRCMADYYHLRSLSGR